MNAYLKVPHGEDLASLKPLFPVFLSYVLSFIFIGIYWNNHHHLLHAAHRVSGGILWANLHLLFWLSMLPFVTGWMGENHFATIPTAVYGFVLLMAGIAYWILERVIILVEGKTSALAKAVGKDIKGHISIMIYLIAIPTALIYNSIAQLLYIFVAVMWLIPDKRIERALGKD